MLALDQLLLLIEQNCWQDAALSAGNIFFCLTLIPMLRHPSSPPSNMYTNRARFACWGILWHWVDEPACPHSRRVLEGKRTILGHWNFGADDPLRTSNRFGHPAR